MPKIGKGGGEGESGPKEPFCFCTNFAFPTEDKLKSNLSTKFIGTVELSVFFSLSIPIPTLLRISADASGDGDSDGDSDGSLLGCRALDDAANKTLRLSSSPQPWLELEVRPPKVRCPPPFWESGHSVHLCGHAPGGRKHHESGTSVEGDSDPPDPN